MPTGTTERRGSDATAADLLCRRLEAAASTTSSVVRAHVRGVVLDNGHRVSTLEEIEVLYRLAASAAGCLRIGQLESVLIRDKNAVTRLVDRLQDAGLARRTTGAGDRRVTLVELTGEGHTILRGIGPAWGAGLREAIARHLEPGDVESAAATLDVLLRQGLAALPTRFGATTGDDADAFALAGLREVAATWSRLRPRVDARHAVLWIRILRLSALVDEALELGYRETAGLSRTEAETLRTVHAVPGGTPPAALRTATGVTGGGVTRITDRLVRRELLVRTPHPTDRRSTLLATTAAGAALAGDARITRERVLATAWGRRPAGREGRDLGRLLERLTPGSAPAAP